MSGVRKDPSVTPGPELKQAVLNALLEVKKQTGVVPAADVRLARATLNYKYSERTIWRWVSRGEVPSWRRDPWEPKEGHREELLRHGSVANLQRALHRAGTETVSERTMQRAFQRQFGTADMTFLRKGFDAADAFTPISAMPDLELNEEWSMDDTQLPVWCIMPDGSVAKPQMQGIREASSRYIVSVTLNPYVYNTEDAMENFANAVAGHTTSNGVLVGGKPRKLRTDRGSNFVARAMSAGLLEQQVRREHSAPYTPHQNGGIERWHRTVKTLFRDLPGYDWCDYKQGDRRKAHEPPPTEQLMHFEELAAETLHRVRAYNTERVHSAHKMTPEECWEKDATANPHLVRRADPVAIRSTMSNVEERLLRRRRVEWNTRFYNLHPKSVHHSGEPDETAEADDVISARARRIRAAEGHMVDVRSLPGRVEYVSVYTKDGEYLGDAVWDQAQTVEQAGETAQQRRRHIKEWTADIETIAVADAAARERLRVEARAAVAVESYAQYDDNAEADEFDEGLPEGRRYRSSRAGGHPANSDAGSTRSGSGSGRGRTTPSPDTGEDPPMTPAQRRAQQRRRDTEAAARTVNERLA